VIWAWAVGAEGAGPGQEFGANWGLAWLDAERSIAAANAEERIARVELIRQLQKNEGALAEIFPGQRRRARSFFRPTRRRGAASISETPESSSTAS